MKCYYPKLLIALTLLTYSQLALAADKWEYGELTSTPTRGGGGGGNSALPVVWITGSQAVSGNDWEGIEAKLGKKAEAEKAATEVDKETTKEQADALTRRINQQRVLNKLGSDGWELVSFYRGDTGLSKWIFKRKLDRT